MTHAPQPSAFIVDAADPDVERAQRQLAVLAELSEIGMDLGRSLRAEVRARVALAQAEPCELDPEAADDEPPGRPGRAGPDYALMYTRLSRAIRLTVVLEDRLAEGLSHVRARTVQARVKADAERLRSRRDVVERLVHEAARPQFETEGESDDDGDDEDDPLDDFMAAVRERLVEDEAFIGIETRPIGETVARVFAEFGLTPDWDGWANQGWALAEAGRPGSPYAAADTG